jgi:rare lipoprotein A
MLIRSNSTHTSIKTPLGICIVAGAAAGILIVLVTPVSTPTVHADTEISRPTFMAPPDPSVASPTPAIQSPVSLAPQPPAPKIASKKRIGIIRGIASWYGGHFNGRETANGETFDMHAMTACQPDLPFGSIVRVINRKNKRSVVVRINDRGDLIDPSRVIDLSWGAAEKLAMTQDGLAKVDIEILSLGGPRGGS